jgi:hypothetical protein
MSMEGVGIIGHMDETTIIANIPSIKQAKNSEWRQVQKKGKTRK